MSFGFAVSMHLIAMDHFGRIGVFHSDMSRAFSRSLRFVMNSFWENRAFALATGPEPVIIDSSSRHKSPEVVC
jgi:hypothetical protein